MTTMSLRNTLEYPSNDIIYATTPDGWSGRKASSFSYYVNVHLPWARLDTAINWCNDECTGDWRWQLIAASSEKRDGQYIFYFDEDRDYFAFTLKWG